MVMAEVRVKQWGNSYGIIIPKEIVHREEINVGDLIKVDVNKNKIIDGFGILKNIKSRKFVRDHDDREEFF